MQGASAIEASANGEREDQADDRYIDSVYTGGRTSPAFGLKSVLLGNVVDKGFKPLLLLSGVVTR